MRDKKETSDKERVDLSDSPYRIEGLNKHDRDVGREHGGNNVTVGKPVSNDKVNDNGKGGGVLAGGDVSETGDQENGEQEHETESETWSGLSK